MVEQRSGGRRLAAALLAGLMLSAAGCGGASTTPQDAVSSASVERDEGSSPAGTGGASDVSSATPTPSTTELVSPFTLVTSSQVGSSKISFTAAEADGTTLFVTVAGGTALWCQRREGQVGRESTVCAESAGGARWTAVSDDSRPDPSRPLRAVAGVGHGDEIVVVGSTPPNAAGATTAAAWVRDAAGVWAAATAVPPAARFTDLAVWQGDLYAMTITAEGIVGLWNSADGRQWTPADLPQGAAGSPRGSLEATDEALFVDYLDPAAADGLAVWSTRNLTQWLSIWFPPGVVDARSDAAIFLGAGSRFAMVSTTSVHIGEVGPFAEVFWLDRIPLPRWPSDGARPSAAMTAKGFVLFDNSDPAGQLWLLADGPRWLPLSGPDDMPVGKDGSGLEAARAEVTAIADLGAGLVLAGAVVPSDEDRPSPRPLAVWNWTPQG